MRQYRFAIAGFQHETNTFAPSRAGLAAFRMADSWPGLLRGQEVVEQTRGMNLPIAGAVQAAEESGEIELVPILWCAAEPSGLVMQDAFDTISDWILDALQKTGHLDALYLDLHGAMVTEHFNGGEAELLRRIRNLLGADFPVGVSLDLHANVSPALVDAASVITVFRTYPHLDMAATGERCLSSLLRIVRGEALHSAFRQATFLVPLHAQFTGSEPCQTLYEGLNNLGARGDEHVDIAMGFTAADVPDCGPSVVGYAPDPQRAEDLVTEVFARLCASEADFDTTVYTPHDAVQIAMHNCQSRPMVLADIQDNPGAGGTSDTTGILQALVDSGAQGALLGVMCDPTLAHKAHRAGIGAVFDGHIGGHDSNQAAVAGRLRVLSLSDGNIPYTGEMYGGGMAVIGTSCLLALEGAPPATQTNIRVVVSTSRIQCLDRALFTHFGADPSTARLLCVKSTVHFRADFDAISSGVINVIAPGAFPCDLTKIQFQNLRPGMRLGPNGYAFQQ